MSRAVHVPHAMSETHLLECINPSIIHIHTTWLGLDTALIFVNCCTVHVNLHVLILPKDSIVEVCVY